VLLRPPGGIPPRECYLEICAQGQEAGLWAPCVAPPDVRRTIGVYQSGCSHIGVPWCTFAVYHLAVPGWCTRGAVQQQHSAKERRVLAYSHLLPPKVPLQWRCTA